MTTDHFAALEAMLPHRLARWMPQFAAAELCCGVDAALMAAIVDRESLGGDILKPPGPGGVGDGGMGHGLAQIDGRFHHRFVVAEFPEGGRLWADPTFNIIYGARILALNVLASRGDIYIAIGGYNCKLERAQGAVFALGPTPSRAQVLAAVDSCTTGGDYVSDVLKRRSRFTTQPLT